MSGVKFYLAQDLTDESDIAMVAPGSRYTSAAGAVYRYMLLDTGATPVATTVGGLAYWTDTTYLEVTSDVTDAQDALQPLAGVFLVAGQTDAHYIWIQSDGPAFAEVMRASANFMAYLGFAPTARVKFEPARGSSAYDYGVLIDSDDLFFVGGAATKSYLVGIFGERPSGSAATGDSNDAVLKMSGSNYAANDSNFIFRGLNCTINNRGTGTLGRIENMLGAQNKDSGVCPVVIGLTVVPENYGTVADVFGGIDIVMKNEGTVATVEFGIRIRNENNSIADAVGAAILITDTGANIGFDYYLDTIDSTLQVAAFRLADDGTLNNDSNSQAIGNLTTAGYIKVIIGTSTRYIWLGSNLPSA